MNTNYSLLSELRRSLVATLVLALILSGIYPLMVWGVAQVFLPYRANGSLMEKGGQVIGSSLLGQKFVSPQYFHPRPSAAGEGYDAANSSGSNLGPLSAKLFERTSLLADDYRKENGLDKEVAIPADAVTASGSGLDPHISPENASLQAPRVARERGLSEDSVKALIAKCTQGPQLGLLGKPRVNVLLLNIELDESAKH